MAVATAVAVSHLTSHSPPHAFNLWSSMEHPSSKPSLLDFSTTARSRRERPCDGCRRRKSKCVLQESRRCVLCDFHRQECTFLENAQPRKRKIDPGRDPVTAGSRKKASCTRPPSSPPPPPPREATLQPAPAPSMPYMHAAPKLNLDAAAAPVTAHPPERRVYHVDETLSLQRNRHCKYLGQTTTLDASLIRLGALDDKNETQVDVGTLRKVADSDYFIIHPDADVQIPDEARALAEIDDIVGPHGPILIDIYFQKVHASYPIIQKEAFLDRHRHGDRQFNPPLLAAMYLLALSWWDAEPAVAGLARPDVTHLEYVAISSLTLAMQRPKISAVQAGLLLLQRAKASTWTLTVQLVALGQDIGLHLDCTDWSIPLWECRLRKRLAWALYMQDKWSSVIYGRPSHINLADWSVPAPTANDFDETIEPLQNRTPDADDSDAAAAQATRGRIAFMQMIALTSIVADVSDTFYSERAKAEYRSAGRYATQLVLSRAKPVQIRLKNWFANLPPECKLDAPPTPATSPSAITPSPFLAGQGYLHLAYFATEISIHRRIVQSLDDHSHPEPSTSSAPPADPYILYICRSAAKTRLISALDFTNRLQPSHLQDFWFFASAANFALIGTFGALLQASSPGQEEAQFYACRLNEYRWTLSVSAKRAPWIADSMRLLDANVRMLEGLAGKPSGLVLGGMEGVRRGSVARNNDDAGINHRPVAVVGNGLPHDVEREDEDMLDSEDENDDDEDDDDDDARIPPDDDDADADGAPDDWHSTTT